MDIISDIQTKLIEETLAEGAREDQLQKLEVNTLSRRWLFKELLKHLTAIETRYHSIGL